MPQSDINQPIIHYYEYFDNSTPNKLTESLGAKLINMHLSAVAGALLHQLPFLFWGVQSFCVIFGLCLQLYSFLG